MKIRTSYDYPPIPIRTMDWSAWDDNTYDADCDQDGYFSTSPCGHGATEFEAILDLLTQLEEKRVGWPDMLDYKSSPTHAAPMKGEAQEGHNKHLPGSALSFRFCVGCKRLLHPWELFADGWRDTTMWCHACLRDAHMAGYYAADETISGREDTEERYS